MTLLNEVVTPRRHATNELMNKSLLKVEKFDVKGSIELKRVSFKERFLQIISFHDL